MLVALFRGGIVCAPDS